MNTAGNTVYEIDPSVQAPGPSLSFRLPTLVVWLSHGLRGPGFVVSWVRLKRGLCCSK